VPTSWQIQRSQLNHNWLQNGVLVGLNHALGVTSGRLKPKKVHQVLSRDIQIWKERRREVPTLLDKLESEMSPRVLFNRIPLRLCKDETKQWLIPLIHGYWLRREKIREKIRTAKKTYHDAERNYLLVKAGLDGMPESAEVREMKACERRLREFKDSCEALSLAISALPREILSL
jgi:hypothetical protein